MTSDEQTLGLLKLFVAVRDKGGYDAVSRKNLWDMVAQESGLGSINASTVKALYVEYLNVLERWLEKAVEDRDSVNSCSSSGDGTGFEFYGLSPNCDDTIAVLKTERDKNTASCGETLCQLDKRSWDIYDAYDLYEDEDTSSLELASNVDNNSDDIDKPHGLNNHKYEKASVGGVDSYVEYSNNCDDYDSDNKEAVVLDSTSFEEHDFSHERKCESMLGMVIWITEIAKNPCNPVIGLLPKSSKWKSHGNEEIWKQALLIRGARLLEGHIGSYAEQSALQNKRPCMFDDHQGSGCVLRQRTKSKKVLPSPSGTSSGGSLILGTEDQLDQEILATDSWIPDYMGKSAYKKIPLGPKFQVEVPEWSGITSESDSKWLGTQVWPLEQGNKASLLKHDLIGKGREDSCKCRMRGSTKCTQFHILKKKYELKLEIGSAFYQWKFDRMGEEVRLRWTDKEEHKFKGAVSSSSESLEQSFRTRILTYFPYKTREDIVCYYFNVFLLHRRRFQNRFSPDNICSDDELEFK